MKNTLLQLQKKVFNLQNTANFEAVALEVFRFHLSYNPLYRQFAEHLNRTNVECISDIPFLPIELFKAQQILITGVEPLDFFQSSGTTGITTSKHYIADFDIYETSFSQGFRHFFGDVRQYRILALLPNYLEQQRSSLVYMVAHLIQQSQNADSGFYLHDHNLLIDKLLHSPSTVKTLLLGVSYALLDIIEQQPLQLQDTLVMETGGMKGRRQEMSKDALHQILKQGFGVDRIYSEYGMTELFSQAYSLRDGIYACPPWMRVCTRSLTDPLQPEKEGVTGAINILDLANLYSCPFIATQDLGKVYSNGTFHVLGRIEGSDLRGCNMLVEN
ncbi:acyltransferase [Bacteroidia bacterium]|nr:acyltransferase [Bacteroidia bacterium]